MRRLWNRVLMRRNRCLRRLEIGPGPERLPGFETLNIVGGRQVDYVADAAGRLPIADNTFDLVYASHILEHIPWFCTEEAMHEWVRVLKPGGRWVIYNKPFPHTELATNLAEAREALRRCLARDGLNTEGRAYVLANFSPAAECARLAGIYKRVVDYA